jgi:hypothetical protein
VKFTKMTRSSNTPEVTIINVARVCSANSVTLIAPVILNWKIILISEDMER